MVYHSMLDVQNHPIKILLSEQRDKDDAKQRGAREHLSVLEACCLWERFNLYLLPRIKVQITFFPAFLS